MNVSDKVITISKHDKCPAGITGKIIEIGESSVLVQFDSPQDFAHDGNRRTPHMCGYYFKKKCLKLLSEVPATLAYLLTYRKKNLARIAQELSGGECKEGDHTIYQLAELVYGMVKDYADEDNLDEADQIIVETFRKYGLKAEYAKNFIEKVHREFGGLQISPCAASPVSLGFLDIPASRIPSYYYPIPTVPTYERHEPKNKKKEVNLMDKIFSNFMPEIVKGDDFALTVTGKLAVKRSDGSYVRYDTTTGKIENQLDLVFGADVLAGKVILMPTKAADLRAGDIIKQKNSYLAVIETSGKIKAVNLSAGTISKMVDESNIIVGDMLHKKVVSMFDMSGANGGIFGGGAGFNPMMLMLMDGKSDGNSDLFKMMALSGTMGGNTGGFNPMMLLLMGDKNGGGGDDLFKLMALSSMAGGANPFASAFGTPTPVEVVPAENGEEVREVTEE
jgi:hypothetical protein